MVVMAITFLFGATGLWPCLNRTIVVSITAIVPMIHGIRTQEQRAAIICRAPASSEAGVGF
ncbi:MAG: hypothetical protein ABIB93_04015 [Chloroflexota bacterium]